MRKLILLSLLFCILLLTTCIAEEILEELADETAEETAAADDSYISREGTKAKLKIESARGELSKMKAAGLSTNRVADTIETAEQLFEAEKIKDLEGMNPDYESVTKKAKEAISLSDQAFDVLDEFTVMKEIIEESKETLDMDEMNLLIADAERELRDERYEKAVEKIEGIYTRMDEMQSIAFRTTAMYSAATDRLREFVVAFYKELALLIGTPIVLFLVFRKKIKKSRIRRKIKNLELQKDVITEQIKQSQRDYFEKGLISETMFHVRENVFAELIRDITQQVSSLAEEEKRIDGGKPV